MIIEVGKDGIRGITKRYLKDNGYTETDSILICIEKYDSVDINKYNSEIFINVNSHLSYMISVTEAKSYLNKLLLAENRDHKLNQILQ